MMDGVLIIGNTISSDTDLIVTITAALLIVIVIREIAIEVANRENHQR